MGETYTSQEALITRKAKEKGIPDAELNAHFNSKLDEVSLKNPHKSVDWRLGRTEYLTWEHYFPGESFPGRMEVASTAARTSTPPVAKKQSPPAPVRAEPVEPPTSPFPRAMRVPPSLSTCKEPSSRDWVHDKYEETLGIDSYRPHPPHKKTRIDSYRPQQSKDNRPAPRSLSISDKQSGIVRKVEVTMGQAERQALNPLANGNTSRLEKKNRSDINRLSPIPVNGNNTGQPYRSQYHTIETEARGLGIPLRQVDKCFEEKAKIAEEKFEDRAKDWQIFFAEASVWGHFFKERGSFPGVEPSKYSEEHCGPARTVMKVLPSVSGQQPKTILSASNVQRKGDDSEPTVILPAKSQHANPVKREPSQISSQLQPTNAPPTELKQVHDPPVNVTASAGRVTALPTSNTTSKPGLREYLPSVSEKNMESKARKMGIRNPFFQYLQKMRFYTKTQHQRCSSLYMKNWYADHLTWNKFFTGPYPFERPPVTDINNCKACLMLPELAPVPKEALGTWDSPARWSDHTPLTFLPSLLTTVSLQKADSALPEVVNKVPVNGVNSGSVLNPIDDCLLTEHFGNSFKDKVVDLYMLVLSKPNAEPATFSILVSRFIPESYRPSRINQDIQRIFKSRLGSEYDGKIKKMKIFASAKILQSGENTPAPGAPLQEAVISSLRQPGTTVKIAKTATANDSVLSSDDEQVLVGYFGIPLKDAIVELYKKVLSKPSVKPPLSEYLSVIFAGDKAVRSRMHMDIHHIFNARLETEYSSETGKLRIFESVKRISNADGGDSASMTLNNVKSTLVLSEAGGVSKNATASNFILSSEDERLLVNHFGVSFKEEIVRFHNNVLSSPQTLPGLFGFILSDPIGKMARPGIIHQDIRRIFNNKLDTQFVHGKSYNIKIFATAKKPQQGGNALDSKIAGKQTAGNALKRSEALLEASGVPKNVTTNCFVLKPQDECLLIEYFGITFKDEIISLYRNIISSLEEPQTFGSILSGPIENITRTAAVQKEVQRIFNSTLDTEIVNGKTCNIRIFPIAKKLRQGGQNSGSQNSGTAGNQPAIALSQQVASDIAPLHAPGTPVVPSPLGTSLSLKDQTPSKTSSNIAKSSSLPPLVANTRSQPPIAKAPRVESHPSSPPPVHLLPTLAQMWQRDPYLGKGTVVMQNTYASISNKTFVGVLYNCFLSDSKESIAAIEEEFRCRIHYHIISTGDFFLWTESYVSGDDNAFNCGHMFLQGWVARSIKFGTVKPSDHWNAIRTAMAPLQMQAMQMGPSTTTNLRSLSEAKGNVGATIADPSSLMVTDRPAISGKFAPINATTVAIDCQSSVEQSAIVESELSSRKKRDVVSEDTQLLSMFEDPENLWQKYKAAFPSSDIERLLMEEKAKTEGDLRMVVDKESGQVINLEELIKRTIYRCSADARKTNELSRGASETNGSSAVQSAPGLAEAGASSKKRKTESGDGAEGARDEKRTCV